MVSTAGAVIITIIVLGVAAAAGWVLYSRWRAQKLGLPPPSLSTFIPFGHKNDSSGYGGPSPRPGGIQGWIGDQITKFKNRNNRSAAGAYEGAPVTSRSGGRRGFGPLDPDEAWDARVGNEADTYGPGGYYEEQELGLHSSSSPYSGDDGYHRGQQQQQSHHHHQDSYAMNLAATPRLEAEDRRPAAAAARNPFDDDVAAPVAPGRNPFDDDVGGSSLRGVSPRPIEGGEGAGHGGAHGGKVTSDNASERRSIFHEDV